MTDTPSPAPMDVKQAKPGLLQRLSLVWLIPVLALAISLGVAWQSYSNQGTEVEIVFENASGIKSGETEIRYRDVVVGKVESLKFAEGLEVVVVTARIDTDIAPYLDSDAQFWVVRPDVSVRGISGLDTVLSGVYIEGSWNLDPQVQQYEFVGLETAPLTRANQRGTEVVLRTSDGSSITTGAPVLHKGIQVGQLEAPRLSADGQSVTVTAFIESPYDRRLTTNTRFWDTSGFSVSFGAGGLALDVNSIASLIEGGIAFDTVVSGGAPVRDGQSFDLFDDEESARSSLFNDPDAPRLEIAALFDGSVNGLAIGSEVRFQGLRIGEVRDLSAVAIEDPLAGPQVQLRTILSIEPGRMGLGEDATPEDALSLIADLVRQKNLRARLITGNILSGALNVELVPVDNVDRNFVDLGGDPYPIIPVTDNVITDVGDEAQSVFARIEALPIEELLEGAVDLMDSVEVLIRSDGVAQVPDEVAALLADARGIVGSDDIQALPAELRGIVTELNAIVAEAGEADLVNRIGGVVDGAGGVVANIDAATRNLPALTAEIEALVAKANALEVEALVTEATATLDSIETLLASEALAAAPATLNGLLDEARSLLSSDDTQAIPGELRGVVGQIDGILATLNEEDIAAQIATIVTSAENAAKSVETASDTLPAITAQLEALAAQTAELDLETLLTEAEGTLAGINALLGAQSTQDLPDSLNRALDELTTVLAQVRNGGAVDNVNAALASASSAARAIEQAANALPALSARASALVAQTDAVVAGFGERSRFSSETLQTLRDVQEAADAISSLARAIQRNPNSLLTGR